MIPLIRFEDAYGMADIILKTRDIPVVPLEPTQNTNNSTSTNNIKKSEMHNIYYECGVSFPAIFIPTAKLLGNIKTYHIDTLILVYDMDSPNQKYPILSEIDLKKYIDMLQKQLVKEGLGKVKVYFLPVVWCAETFALYILANKYSKNSTEITKILHSKNIAKFHGEIIKKYLEYYDINAKPKKLRDYIGDKDNIITSLKKFIRKYPDSINKKTIEWIITNDSQYLFDDTDALSHQREVGKYYQNNLPDRNEQFNAIGSKLDMNKICWK